MSTWIYLRCDSHMPPILAEDESGQHLSDLPRIRAELAEGLRHQDWEIEANRLGRWYNSPDKGEQFDSAKYFRWNTAKFLKHHATCNIRIEDEYGREWPTEDEED